MNARVDNLQIVLAVVFGIVVATAVHGQLPQPPDLPDEQQRAVKEIERRHGHILRDKKITGQPVTEVHYSYDDERQSRGVNDDALKLLSVFPSLQLVSASNAQITDAGLAELARIPTLETLRLESLKFTDSGLAHLAKLPNLQYVYIQFMPLTDGALKHFVKCPRLRVIRLDNTSVTENGIARLKEAMPYSLIATGYPSDPESQVQPQPTSLTLPWKIVGIVLIGSLSALVLAKCRWGFARRHRWLWKMPIVASVILATLAAIQWAAPTASTIHQGNAARSWVHACAIDVGVQNATPDHGFYLPRDGLFFYYGQGIHGRILYQVPEADAMALFPKVVERLRDAPPGVLRPAVEAGFREWERSGSPPGDASGLLAEIRENELERLKRSDWQMYEYHSPDEDHFAERWKRMQRFHWNVWFETAFLSFFIVFAAWPWLRGAGRRRWAIQIALLPPLFCLPFWLGYAPLTFTSAGGHEGILYPALLHQFRGLPWSDLDTAILRQVPRLLEPLAQFPGPMMAISGFGAPGPIEIFGVGIGAGLLFLATAEAIRLRGGRAWREILQLVHRA